VPAVQRVRGRVFPLSRFSERVYGWRKAGDPYLNTEAFEEEAASLASDRLMIQRHNVIVKETRSDEITRWFFRHDKITEFFLLPALMNPEKSRRRFDHFPDEQFFGVYELLAVRLSDPEEQVLRNSLIEWSADTNSHELLNRYTRARRFRPP
jgi:hypothetical protein